MPDTQDRRKLVWITAVVLVVLGVGGYLGFAPNRNPDNGASHQRMPSRSGMHSPTSTPDQPSAVDTGPQISIAVNWLINYHSARWFDPDPTAWINRTLPYITPKLATSYQQDRDAPAGKDWSTFVAHQCTTTVTDTHGVIPTEAPRSSTSVFVDVSGTAVTTCTNGSAPVPRQRVSATVEVVQSGGVWRVDSQPF